MVDLSLLDLPQLLSMDFFRYALIGGAISAVSCSWVGLYLVLRKQAMIGDGIAHTAFGGIALGLLLGVNPILTALVVSIAGTVGLSYMTKKGMARSDSGIAVVMAIGFSMGLIIIGLAEGFDVDLFDYLFGSILTIGLTDLITVSVLGVIVLLFMTLFRKELLVMTFDEVGAKLSGIPVATLSLAFNILVAVTIVLSIKVIGVVLVVALIVLPALSALQFRLSFRMTSVLTVIFGVTSTLLGTIISAVYDLATSGVIVFTAAAIFVFCTVYRRLGRNG